MKTIDVRDPEVVRRLPSRCVRLAVLAGALASAGCGDSVVPEPVPNPAILSLSPSTVLAGSASTSITIYGKNFPTASEVIIEGDPIPTTFVSTEVLTAAVPATYLAAPGSRSIGLRDVLDPFAGTQEVELGVHNPVPTLDSVSPTVVPLGFDATFAVTGTNFAPGAKAWFGDEQYPLGVTHPTTGTFTVPAARLQTGRARAVRIENLGPGGGSSAIGGVVSVALTPSITEVAPANVLTGSGTTTIEVTGPGLIEGAQIEVGGVPRPTTWLFDGRLTFDVSAADIASNGSVPFRVKAPDPHGRSATNWVVSMPPSPTAWLAASRGISNHMIAVDDVRNLVYVLEYSNRPHPTRVLALDGNDLSDVWSLDLGFRAETFALTDDAQFLYVAGNNANVYRVDVATQSIVLTIPLGFGARAYGLAAVPGNPHQVVASVIVDGRSPNGVGSALYTDTIRSTVQPYPRRGARISIGDNGKIYIGNQYELTTSGGELVLEQSFPSSHFRAQASGGYLISDLGQVFDLQSGFELPWSPVTHAFVADPVNGRIHYIPSSSFELYTIHHGTHEPLGLNNVGVYQPRDILRIGSDRLALGGGLQVAIVTGPLIGS